MFYFLRFSVVLFFLLFVISTGDICYSNSAKILVRDYKTDLGRSFARIVTQRQAVRQIPKRDELHSEMHQRWIKSLYNNNNQKQKDTPHIEFHKRLGAKILAGKAITQTNLELHKPKNLPDQEVAIKQFEGKKRNFIYGHIFSTGEYDVTFPIVLTTLYAEEKKSPVNWFMPIEQALLCSTLGEYRSNAAVLRDWSAYSRVGLTVLPPGSTVNIGVGLVSPQSLPKIDEEFFEPGTHQQIIDKKETYQAIDTNEIDHILYAVNNNNNREVTRFFERRKGGATQFYIKYAYDKNATGNKLPIKVFELKDLFPGRQFPSKQPLSVLPQNPSVKNTWVWDPSTIRNTHFFYDNYDKTSLDLPDTLLKQNYIDIKERDDINDILNMIKNSI